MSKPNERREFYLVEFVGGDYGVLINEPSKTWSRDDKKNLDQILFANLQEPYKACCGAKLVNKYCKGSYAQATEVAELLERQALSLEHKVLPKHAPTEKVKTKRSTGNE